MKVKLLFIALVGFALVGCKSDIDKCVDAYVESEIAYKDGKMSDDDIKHTRSHGYLMCLKISAGN